MADKYKVGDYYIFGNYMQGPSDTDKTPIEWEILDLRDDKVTLISRYILDVYEAFTDSTRESIEEDKRYCPFFTDSGEWIDADEWVNGEFRETAFSEEEQKMIDGDVRIPSIDDLKRYFSGRCFELIHYHSYGDNECIGLFGKELIATGTKYALLRGLTERVVDNESDVPLWSDSKYLDAYFSIISEDFHWHEKADAREIIGKTSSSWLLTDDCFVDFDTTADESISWEDSESVNGCILGIRPMITLNVSDIDAFEFKYTTRFFNDLSVSLYSKNPHIKKHLPATGEDIALCREELDKRLDYTDALPDDYISFLKITNGIGKNVLFGTEGLLKNNDGSKKDIVLGEGTIYYDRDDYHWEYRYNPELKKYYAKIYSWPNGDITEFYTFEDFFRFVFKDEIEAGYISV